MKNILITAIMNFDDRDNCDYYLFEKDGQRFYTDGVVCGEAGSKYILSRVDIDMIILVGSELQNSGGRAESVKSIDAGFSLSGTDPQKLNDYDFFRYRLMQFVNGVDMETQDIMETVPQMRRDEILKCLHDYFGNDESMIFDRVYDEPKLYTEFINNAVKINYTEKTWLHRYIYAKCGKSKRVNGSSLNKDIPVVFVPIMHSSSNSSIMNGINSFVKQLSSVGNDEIHIYADVQGFNQMNSYIFLSILGAIDRGLVNPFRIEEITYASDVPRGFIYRITNARKRMEVSAFLSAVNSIVEDGHTGQLRAYWRKTGVTNEYIDKLMYALGTVETGVLISNIEIMVDGILNVHELVNQPYEKGDDSSEEEIFIITLRGAIAEDYKNIVNLETKEINILELLKWTWKKNYLQQCITVLESKVPQDMVEQGIFYPCRNEEDKEKYIKVFNAVYWDMQRKDRWKLQDIRHYFIKYEGMNYVSSHLPRGQHFGEYLQEIRGLQIYAESTPGHLLRAYSRIPDKESFMKVYGTYREVSLLRNKVNHGETIRDCDALSENENAFYDNRVLIYVKEKLKEFIDIYEETLNMIKDTPYEHVDIPQEEFDEYCKTHGPRYCRECFRASGYYSENPRFSGKRRKRRFYPRKPGYHEHNFPDQNTNAQLRAEAERDHGFYQK